MTVMLVEQYSQALALVERIAVAGLAPLPGSTPRLVMNSCYWTAQSVNMGITERIGQLSIMAVNSERDFRGVPIAYPLYPAADGTQTDWNDEAGAMTDADAIWSDAAVPPNFAGPYMRSSGVVSPDQQDIITQSAAAAGIPSATANHIVLSARINGALDYQFATKTPQSDAKIRYSGNDGTNYPANFEGTLGAARYVFTDVCPIENQRPGSTARLARADFDGTNLGLRLDEVNAGRETRVLSMWIEALTCDGINNDNLKVWASNICGAESVAGGMVNYCCGIEPNPVSAPADLLQQTGDADFPGGYYFSVNRNKASPFTAIRLAMTDPITSGPHGRAEMWCAYKPSGTPSAAGSLMEMVFKSFAGGASSLPFNVKLNTSRMLDLYYDATLVKAGGVALQTGDIQYIRLYVAQEEGPAITIAGAGAGLAVV